MVGGLSLVGSLVVDSFPSPCLCLDSFASAQMNHTGSTGEPGSNRKPSSRKHLVGMGSVALGTCFVVGSSRVAAKAASSKNKRRGGGFVVVNELGGQYEDSFHDVKAQIFNLFTYKAVKTVMNQLYEMNPTQYRWFYEFVVTNKPTDGKRFLRVLQKEKQELAERVMVTRLHLYGKWIKKLDHAEMYKDLSDQNLELMRERLLETVKWPFDDTK